MLKIFLSVTAVVSPQTSPSARLFAFAPLGPSSSSLARLFAPCESTTPGDSYHTCDPYQGRKTLGENPMASDSWFVPARYGWQKGPFVQPKWLVQKERSKIQTAKSVRCGPIGAHHRPIISPGVSRGENMAISRFACFFGRSTSFHQLYQAPSFWRFVICGCQKGPWIGNSTGLLMLNLKLFIGWSNAMKFSAPKIITSVTCIPWLYPVSQ